MFFRYVAAAAFAGASAFAQQSIHHASLGGRVTDISGGVVESARVEVRHAATKVTRASLTDREGRFRFPYLSPGSYSVTVGTTGFKTTSREITLAIGGAYDLPVVLAVVDSSSTVLVTADAALLETARSQVAGAVVSSEIAHVPLNGRNFLELALLIPGVSPTNTSSTQAFPETSVVPGQGLSINSQRNFSNGFIVDGLSANDDAAGLSGVPFPVDAIAEFQVVTSGGQAEFGRALGGYVNVITRGGTNTVQGSLYGYLRNQRWNARNPLSHTKLPMTQTQYGANIGGPVRQDRIFYFGDFEQRRLNQWGLTTIDPSNVAAIRRRLAETGYRGAGLSTGVYANPLDSSNGVARVDYHASSADLVTLRYVGYRVVSENARGAGGLSAPSAASALDNTDHNAALSYVRTLSPHVVNEARGQFTRSGLGAAPNDMAGPSVAIAGVATFGRMSGSPTERRNRLYEVTDNLSVQAGAHAFRVGASYLHNQTNIVYPRSVRGSYSFSSLANFLAGTYNNLGFAQTFGPSAVSQQNPNVGLFVQDEWKPAAGVTVNVGVRYDLQSIETIRADRNNLAPRAGVTWAPFSSRRTVIRASHGLFYDRVPLRAVANVLLSSHNTTELTAGSQVVVSLSPTQAGAPRFPATLPDRPQGVLANFTTMDRDMQNAYSVQTAVEMEQQVSARSTISVGYQQLRGLHLIASINRNAPTCVASGANNGCRPNPAFANNSQYSAAGDSSYRGLHISYVQRPARWGSYRISYTYSKSMNNVGEFFFSSPINPFNMWEDWGRSDDDQRHRLVWNGTARAPFGIVLSGTMQYYSSLPFNVTAGTTTVQGTAARPVVNGRLIERNAGTGFGRLQVNVRASRTFTFAERVRVEALAEMFNVTNRVNGVTLNGTFGTGAYPFSPARTFGQITGVGEPRSAQFGLRVSF